MVECKVALQEFREEVKDMLCVCFDGEVRENGANIEIILQNGQRFQVNVGEAG